MGWQNVFSVILEAGNTIINPNGVFIYSGNPAHGNLLVSIAGQAGVDNFNNPYSSGLQIYGPNGALISLVDDGTQAAMLLNPAGAAHVTVEPQVSAAVLNPGAANENIQFLLTSGKESGKADAALQLFSESDDGTIPPLVVIEFGGTVFCTIGENALIMPGDKATPGISTGQMTMYATSGGSMRVGDGNDAQVYATERRSLVTGGNQTINSTTFASVISSTLGASATSSNQYRIYGRMLINPSQAAGGFAIQFVCLTASAGTFDCVWYSADNSAPAAIAPVAFCNEPLGNSLNPGIVMAAAHTYMAVFNGTVTIPAGSNPVAFFVEFATPNAGDNYVIAAGSFLDIMPV